MPRKNVRDFAGRPILAYSIEAALGSGCFRRVVVSTEDAEIADVARRHGAEVPFLRPVSLASDTAREFLSVRHAMDWYRGRGETFDRVCCVYATAPFLRGETIREGLRVLEAGDYVFVFPVTTFEFPILRSLRREDDDRVVPAFPEAINRRSQDLEEHFHDAGQFYWGSAAAFDGHDTPFAALSNRVGMLRIPRTDVQDIDTEEDWRVAEALFLARRG